LALLPGKAFQSGLAVRLDARAALAMIVVHLARLETGQDGVNVVEAMANVSADAAGDEANRLSAILFVVQGEEEVRELPQQGCQRRDRRRTGLFGSLGRDGKRHRLCDNGGIHLRSPQRRSVSRLRTWMERKPWRLRDSKENRDSRGFRADM
jgi:hypothetical protein